MRKKDAGTIRKNGQEIQINGPSDTIDNKIGLLTEDRRKNGIVGVRDIMGNQHKVLGLVVMCLFMMVASPTFATYSNIMSILTSESIIGIITVGVMWTILAKGIDLSPGAVVGLTSVVSASLMQCTDYASRMFPNLPDVPVVLTIVVSLVVGTAFGLLSGLLIAYAKSPPFIATLGTQLIRVPARSFIPIHIHCRSLRQALRCWDKDMSLQASCRLLYSFVSCSS